MTDTFETVYGTITAEYKKGRIWLTSPFYAKDAIKQSLAGARFDWGEKKWHVEDCNRNWYMLGQVWCRQGVFMRYYDQPNPSDVPAALKQYEKLLQIHPSHTLAVNLRPGVPDYWPEQRMRGYMGWYLRNYIDTSDMGVGKSRSYFLSCELAIAETKVRAHLAGDPDPCLDVWWITSKPGQVGIKKHFRQWQPTFTPRVFCTFDGLARAIDKAARPPRVVVCDELHACKNPKTARFRELLGLREMMEEAYGSRCWFLAGSGTPAANNYLDWWALCEVARPGFLNEGTFYKYRERYCNLVKCEYAPVDVVDTDDPWKEEIKKLPGRLKPLCFGHSVAQCTGKLGTISYERVHLEPSRSMSRVARAIANSGDTALGTLNRLRQLSDGHDPETGTNVPSPKTGLLIRLLEQNEEVGRFVVFAAYRRAIDLCVETALEAGWGVIRVDGRGWAGFGGVIGAEKTFLDTDRHPVKICLIAHPQSGGESVDFTSARAGLFYSNGFNAGQRMQAIKRLYRPGQDCHVTIYDAIHLSTDEYVLDKITNKIDNLKWSLDVIRGEFEEQDEPSEFEAMDWLRKMT